MSILIKDMEMPTERESFNLTIKYNGTVLDTETGIQVAEAYELSPHGDLIDRDKLLSGDGVYLVSFQKSAIDTMKIIKAPTIIPADTDKEKTWK